ncbi:hypothetical protein V2J09_005610 [Rumex salicifolius]
MATRASSFGSLTLGLLMIALLVGQSCAQLTCGYYKGKCGKTDVEKLIFKLVKKKMHDEGDKGLVGDLVRLSFHDCFVRVRDLSGCDASVLLDGKHTEKMATPNLDLDGLQDIDDIKEEVEKACPGVVSCADILVIATRATVYLAGGKWYAVETGRKDSLVSIKEEAENVPGPNITMTNAIKEMANIGLNVYDLVVLLGAHTVGVVHCNNFQDRLYNYHNTGKPDPAMDPSLVKKLIKTCPKHLNGTQNEAFLDQTPGSEDTIDTSFYKNIMAHKGVVDFDQRMAFDPRTKGLVKTLAYDSSFSEKFGQAMIKMTKIGVLTGKKGEVRKSCRAVNKNRSMKKRSMATSFGSLTLGLLMIALLVGQSCAQLTCGYYKGKCGKTDVEKLIFKLVKKKMHDEGDKGLGCDASVMLDGKHTEKMATPNLDLDGLEDIDDIKEEVEKACPGVVSCADILVIATRATVYLAGGKWYAVETGRKDSLVSIKEEAENVPGPNITMTNAIKEMANIGLNVYDLVVLLGAHTVGVVHCNNFQDRLYNYHNTGKPDPSMDPSLVKKLIKTCPKHLNGTQNEAFLDQTSGSEDTIDTSFYKNIMAHKGVVDFDQRMAFDPRTRGLVKTLAYDSSFSEKFGQAMIKMTKIGVLTGKKGEVRKSCRAVNKN